MKTSHLALMLATAVAFAAAAPATGPSLLGSPAHAQGASGGGFGGPGVGTSGGHVENETAIQASDPSTAGLEKAMEVVGTTPAGDEESESNAMEALEGAEENQAGATGQGSSMSLGEALGNAAEDAQGVLSAIFGGSGSTSNP